jgi:chromosome segregation protein
MAQHEAAAAFPLRAVTLKGEVFLASGPVWSAGSGAPPEDASGASQSTNGGQTVLSRQRQRREARRRLEETADRESALRIQIAELEGRLKDLQGAGEQIAQAQRQARQGEEQAALAARQVKLEEEQAARQQRWQQEQWERLQAELRGGEAESQQLEAQLAQIETEISQQRDEVRQRSARLAELTLEEYQAQVSHWDTRHAVAERAFEDSQRRLRERQAALEQARNAIASRLARQVEIEQSLAALEEGKTTQRQAESQAAEEIEALRALIEPAEAELEQAEKELSGLQNQEATARQALSQAEHHHAQARIQLNRRQEALESLQRRIEDDFGLVAFEYREEVSGPTPLPLEGMVEQLPMVSELSPEIEETIKRQRAQLHRMGAINPEARAEYQEVKQRFSFLTGQVADLQKAEADVRQVIAELDALMEREFRKTFEAVAAEFKEIFTRLFGGGSAQLVLTDPDDLTDTGIDIEARLPGRRTQGLSLLSGGERSLTAAALVFALLKVSPTPFCVLDEVDAMLDEANVGRFRDLLRELSENTQFVVVTHNRNTVQAAEVIYGITMGRDSASQMLSLKLDEVGRVVEP